MFDTKPSIKISNSSQKTFNEIIQSETSILCGKNNCGKTWILQRIHSKLGKEAIYLGVSRLQNFSVLGNVGPNSNKDKQNIEFLRKIATSKQNIDSSNWSLQRSISYLTNEKRELLFKIVWELLGSEMTIRNVISDNDMSQKYISVDGFNLGYTSSGFRQIVSILCSLLDEDYKYFIIDEPEQGISPENQAILADFLFDIDKRKEFFPHIKKIFIATHSISFINRKDLKTNYYVSRNNLLIEIIQQTTYQELNNLQFFLLGNRFESLYLPSIILLVEGICDFQFFKKVISIFFPDSTISVISCNGDNKIKEYLHFIKSMLGQLQKSPYSNRIVAVLDSIHQKGLSNQLKKMGVPSENIIVWEKNGIEHYYPKGVLVKIFGNHETLEIDSDLVSANGIKIKKTELVDLVCQNLSHDDIFTEEFNQKFFSRIKALTY